MYSKLNAVCWLKKKTRKKLMSLKAFGVIFKCFLCSTIFFSISWNFFQFVLGFFYCFAFHLKLLWLNLFLFGVFYFMLIHFIRLGIIWNWFGLSRALMRFRCDFLVNFSIFDMTKQICLSIENYFGNAFKI